MASINSEYHRFLTHLSQREVHENVRRFAHLVLAQLKPLSEVGATRRARSTRLVPLAVKQLMQTPVVLEGLADNSERSEAIGRLLQLEVGPFRGFMRQETFDLSHDITLIYGANGTGKSSFFEALELAMLGSISEAQIKRIDGRVYCNNARLQSHVTPVLMSGSAEASVVVHHDEARHRFCFIEKNRLDDFARIAARTAGDQRQLIATLFGVDQFSEFVRGFNPALDSDLMLVGVKATQLAQQRQQLATSEQAIAAYPNKLADIEVQEIALAESMFPGVAYQACIDWILGTPDQQGRLPFLQAQLDAIPPIIHDVTPTRLEHLLSEAYRLNGEWQSVTAQLAARASEVSYTQLYQAVQALAEGATACPACGTALDAVSQNPFEKAKAGLIELAQLADLQQREGTLRISLNEAIQVLLSGMRQAVNSAGFVCPHELQSAGLPILPDDSAGTWLTQWIEGEKRHWNALLQLARTIERVDAENLLILTQRESMAQERNRLNQHWLEIERLRTLRKTADQEVANARLTVNHFDEANRELIQDVEAEIPIVALHHQIKAAYDAFLPEIQGYLAALPGFLLQGLGEQAKNLYNAFNRNDTPGDLLHSLWLPIAENSKIEIEFASEPGKRYDALIVLSEGHIKCLGLAILLAKNIEQKCPFVIFDDVVNAIDDEHRDGIWRTFFDDGLLDDKQIILTSHAEEFLHRIQQELGASRAKEIKRYKFLPHHGEHELRIDSDPPVKNYVLLAQRSLEADDKREALRNARSALEAVTDSLWTWMVRRGVGRLEMNLNGPRSTFELNNKCSKLRTVLRKMAVNDDGLQGIVNALDVLLDKSGASIEWGYLNGAVHDSQRDHEFVRSTVQSIVESIVILDADLTTVKNRK